MTVDMEKLRGCELRDHFNRIDNNAINKTWLKTEMLRQQAETNHLLKQLVDVNERVLQRLMNLR